MGTEASNMRYISSTIIMTVVVLAGCKGSNQSGAEFDPLTDANVPYDPAVIDLDAGESQGWAEPSRTIVEQPVAYGEPAASMSLYSPSGKMHLVKRRDTLYSLARLYYNDHRQWKKIYEANRDRIANPNMIKVGMNLVIP